jgi:hypothetical protein
VLYDELKNLLLSSSVLYHGWRPFIERVSHNSQSTSKSGPEVVSKSDSIWEATRTKFTEALEPWAGKVTKNVTALQTWGETFKKNFRLSEP